MARKATISGGSEQPSRQMMKVRKELTSRGYPELARQAQPYWDVEQAIKTHRAHNTTKPEK